jgi:hypothetical protein
MNKGNLISFANYKPVYFPGRLSKTWGFVDKDECCMLLNIKLINQSMIESIAQEDGCLPNCVEISDLDLEIIWPKYVVQVLHQNSIGEVYVVHLSEIKVFNSSNL